MQERLHCSRVCGIAHQRQIFRIREHRPPEDIFEQIEPSGDRRRADAEYRSGRRRCRDHHGQTPFLRLPDAGCSGFLHDELFNAVGIAGLLLDFRERPVIAFEQIKQIHFHSNNPFP